MPYAREPALRAQRRRAAACTSRPDGELTLDWDDEITARRMRRRGKEEARTRMSHNTAARLRADDPRARDLPRLRGDLEGADDAAHAADVRHERDPRHRDRRRDDRRRAAGQGRARPGSSGSSRSCSRPPTSSAASSSPTGCSRCSRSASRAKVDASANGKDDRSREHQRLEPALPGHDRDLHPRAAVPLRPGARAPRQPDRRGRDGARDRRHLGARSAPRAGGRSRSGC